MKLIGTPKLNIRALYDSFDAPVTEVDCGAMCAPHNPHGKPFCCDICEAVPAAYHQEWAYLQVSTELWQPWRGDECGDQAQATGDAQATAELLADLPETMRLLACQGPAHCQRPFRLLSCRQFPFFPYITSDLRFIGLAYEWEFEPGCWVLSNLGQVTETYRTEFVRLYNDLLERWPAELEGYAIKSEQMREAFAAQRRRIPILSRTGGIYLVSPVNERLYRTTAEALPRFGPYRNP